MTNRNDAGADFSGPAGLAMVVALAALPSAAVAVIFIPFLGWSALWVLAWLWLAFAVALYWAGPPRLKGGLHRGGGRDINFVAPPPEPVVSQWVVFSPPRTKEGREVIFHAPHHKVVTKMVSHPGVVEVTPSPTLVAGFVIPAFFCPACAGLNVASVLDDGVPDECFACGHPVVIQRFFARR